MRIILALATVIISFSVLVFLWRLKIKEQKNIRNRMAYFSGSIAARQEQIRQGNRNVDLKTRFREIVHQLAVKLQKVQKNNPMDAKMQQADWPLMGTEFEIMLLIFGLLLGLVVFLTTFDIMLTILALVVGIVLGLLFLNIYISRRQQAFTNQLGDMLQMVSNAMRAGFSFLQAFELIAREMDAPIGREVQKVVSEINVGATMDTALENMQKRVQSADFELVVTAVLIQRQVGGNLAQILDTIGATIEERVKVKREVKALTAQGRASGYLLSGLPFALGLILYTINPDYLKPLWTETYGRMAIMLALVFQVIGFMVIRKIVDIKL